jgi:hypothetical protein
MRETRIIRDKALVDWDKDQWLVYKDLVCYSSGEHNGDFFHGFVLPSERGVGYNSSSLSKFLWTPVNGDLTIIIGN